MRARAKANRYLHENERGTSEVLVKYLNVDPSTALETYRLTRRAFTTDGVPAEEEIREYLGADTLGYLSVEGLRRAVGDTEGRFCLACYTGNYPTTIQEPLIALRNRD